MLNYIYLDLSNYIYLSIISIIIFGGILVGIEHIYQEYFKENNIKY